MKYKNTSLLFFLLTISLMPCQAFAACSSPTAEAGELRYHGDFDVLQYCDGTNWIAAGICGNNEGNEGNAGYFVLTESTWDGNLGGRSGANAKCLAELQAEDWKGKNSAVLNSSTVRAFICDHDNCNEAVANQTYYFAKAGNAAIGGASFTANASGYGVVGSASWATPNHFGGAYMYWVGGRDHSSDTEWGGEAYSSDRECTQYWNSTSSSGSTGRSWYTDDRRWAHGSRGCADQVRLICFVHP